MCVGVSSKSPQIMGMERREGNRRASAAESSVADSSSIPHFFHHRNTQSLYSSYLLLNNPNIGGFGPYSNAIKNFGDFCNLDGKFRLQTRQDRMSVVDFLLKTISPVGIRPDMRILCVIL